MKKSIMFLLVILFLFSGFSYAGEKSPESIVTKSYTLKYTSPKDVHRTLRTYILNASYQDFGKLITVKLREKEVPQFEKLLNQMDVPKKQMLIRIFTVTASPEAGLDSRIDNPDLKRVIGELQKVLSFKSYQLDGVSAVTVKDGQHFAKLVLSSKSAHLEFNCGGINVIPGNNGQSSVGFRFGLKQVTDKFKKGGEFIVNHLMESVTSVKENGYLVAGVSRIGKNGNSLILVINAQMK